MCRTMSTTALTACCVSGESRIFWNVPWNIVNASYTCCMSEWYATASHVSLGPFLSTMHTTQMLGSHGVNTYVCFCAAKHSTARPRAHRTTLSYRMRHADHTTPHHTASVCMCHRAADYTPTPTYSIQQQQHTTPSARASCRAAPHATPHTPTRLILCRMCDVCVRVCVCVRTTSVCAV